MQVSLFEEKMENAREEGVWLVVSKLVHLVFSKG